MDDNDKELLLEFITECHENLENVTQKLIALESSPSDTSAVDSIFRSIHTIKGTSGFFNFTKLEKITHVGENILNKLRKKECELSHDLSSLLLEMVDTLKEILAYISQHSIEPENDYVEIIGRLEAALGQPQTVAELPSCQSLNPEANEASPIIVTSENVNESEMPQVANTSETLNDFSNAKSHETTNIESNKADFVDNSIRVNVTKLDKLMDLVSELVLVRNQILQLVNEHRNIAWNQVSQNLNQITSELQENIMNTRMQPISTLWKKYPRLVRDIGLSSGKEIKLEMEGSETELDKRTIEVIKDPLTHLLRNAIDHGIETTQGRVDRNKCPYGRIRLEAKHESGYVIIQIKDDGKGLDFKKIKNKAIERNLITQEEAEIMSKTQLMQLIFQPGFSTADKVTNISGRGVGMDVVKTQIEKIGGTVDIDTEEGKGSIFTIKIPLTMAIVKVIIIEIDGDLYAVPQNCLSQLMRIKKNDVKNKIEKIGDQLVYRLRNKLLPLVSLRSILFAADSEIQETDEIVNVIILNLNGNEFGLIVDKIRDTKEIVIKPLEGMLKEIPIYSGATILGDGTVALIFEVNGLAGLVNIDSIREAQAAHNEQSRKMMLEESEIIRDSLILVEIENGIRLAIPVNEVVRLEEIPINKIEKAGDYEVIQYRDTIMPLISLSTLLDHQNLEKTPLSQSDQKKLPTIVCNYKNVTTGVIVKEIIDIVNPINCELKPATRTNSLGNIVIHDRTTELIDISSILHETKLNISYTTDGIA